MPPADPPVPTLPPVVAPWPPPAPVVDPAPDAPLFPAVPSSVEQARESKIVPVNQRRVMVHAFLGFDAR
jgi:hypothetical protein